MPGNADLLDDLQLLRSVKEEAAAALDSIQSEVGRLREQLGRMAAALDRAEALLGKPPENPVDSGRKRRPHSRPNRATDEQRARLNAVHLAGGKVSGPFVTAAAISKHLASPTSVGDLTALLEEQVGRGHLDHDGHGGFRLTEIGDGCRLYRSQLTRDNGRN